MVGECNIGAIIQARYNSERLPGKIVMPLPINSSTSILGTIIGRLGKVKQINKIIVATTRAKEDDRTEQEAIKYGVECFRGSTENVLERFIESSKKYNLQHVIRITADNPCIDPNIIADCLDKHLANGNDYTRTFCLPLGTNLEIVSFAALQKSFDNATTIMQLEHVTPYMYQNPDLFKIQVVDYDIKSDERLRLTVDYPSDYAFVNLLFSHFGNNDFGIPDILEYVSHNNWLIDINPNIQKKVAKSVKEELIQASDLLKKYDFLNAKELIDSKLKEK
jgi:spore coat polysaccharide biosynthesis protein SpsF